MEHKTDSYSIYAIGKNYHCELGIPKEKEFTSHLTNVMNRLNTNSKAQIYSGNKFTFYCINGHNYFAGGDNEYGQCGFENHYPMTKLESMDYFDDKEIEIKKVCTNVTSTKTFWITKNNMIYGHGQNEQLCLFNERYYDIYPQLIAPIGNKKPYQIITDIKSSTWCTIALSNLDDITIMATNNWTRNISQSMIKYFPADIMTLIKLFTHRSHIWWTKNGFSWEEAAMFRDNPMAIKQISMGLWHVLFLENNGAVWVHGKDNTEGQCGIIERRVCNIYPLCLFDIVHDLMINTRRVIIGSRSRYPCSRQHSIRHNELKRFRGLVIRILELLRLIRERIIIYYWMIWAMFIPLGEMDLVNVEL